MGLPRAAPHLFRPRYAPTASRGRLARGTRPEPALSGVEGEVGFVVGSHECSDPTPDTRLYE